MFSKIKMVYMRGKRRYYRKKQTKTKSNYALTKKVNKIDKLVSFLKPEINHYDFGATGGVLDNNPTFFLFPCRDVSVGDSDYGNRTGDKLKQMRYTFKADVFLGAGFSGARVRVLAFIYTRNPDGLVSSGATGINLFLSSATMNTTTAPLAYLDWDNNSTFKKIYDKTYTLNANEATLVKRQSIDTFIRIPKKYQDVHYIGSGTVPTKNELIFCIISSSDTACTMDYNARYAYIP